MDKIKILFLEDTVEDATLVKRELKKAGMKFTFEVVDTRQAYEKGIKHLKPDVVLSDHVLPEFNSIAALKIYNEYKNQADSPVVFILVTGSVSEEFAVEIMQGGADDYILKDRLTRLPSAIQKALEKNRIILEKKKIEEKQKRLLHDIELLLNSTSEGIYGINKEGNCIFINKAALDMLRLKKKDCIGKNMHKLVHGKKKNHRHYPESECPIRHSMIKSQGCTISNEVFWRSDGSAIDVEYTSNPVMDGAVAKGAVVTFTDISEKIKEQRKKELAVSLSKIFSEEESFETCLQLILQEICAYDDKPVAEAWVISNDQKELRLFSWFSIEKDLIIEKDESVMSIGEGLLGEAWNLQEPVFLENVQTDPLFKRKKYARRNNLYSALAMPIIFKSNVIAILIFYSNKVLKNREAFLVFEETLLIQLAIDIQRKKTEDELNNFFNISPDMLCVAGTDGYFKKINPAFSKVLGYSEKELLEKPYLEFVHPDDREITVREAENLTYGKPTYYFENRYITKDGDVRWFAWTSTALDEKGLIIAVAKDLTERIMLEKTLEKERKQKQKEITDAVLSAQENERQDIGRELHDNISQVLASARLYLTMVNSQKAGQDNYLGEAEELIANAINEIRSLSHKLIPKVLTDSDLKEAIKNLTSVTEKSAGYKIECEISKFSEKGIPDKLKLALYRIIQEQLHNISKHAKAKNVQINLKKDEQMLYLIITDDGVGFDTAAKSKGVGLMNMKARAEVFNGQLNIISSPGSGCRLEVSIPKQNGV